MLELGVDEVTLVLQLSKDGRRLLNGTDWENVSENLIYKFGEVSKFRTVFGNKTRIQNAFNGYSIAYTYGEHNFFVAIAYHPFHMNMGICIKLSAQAWDYYSETTALKIYDFLQQIKHRDYTARLSRIDFTVDYIDEDIDVTDIYNNLMAERVVLCREYVNAKTGKMEYKKISFQYRGFAKGQQIPTIYIGSPQSDGELRIYNKKQEQLERHGTKYTKATQCDSWVRFEGVFRGKYAHQISDELMKVQNDNELANLIALTISQKFYFMENDNGILMCTTDYTQMLVDCILQNNFKLKAASSRNYDLAVNIKYLFNGSGIMNTLYKVLSIWDINAVLELFDYMIEVLENDYRPNDDCRYWLNKNLSDYQKSYPDYDSFVRENLLPLL